MDVRSMLRRYADLLLALGAGSVYVTEVALWERADLVRAVPGALLATLPLALRRRSPLLALVLVTVGIQVVSRSAPGLDNQSLGIIVAFFVALYSVGRHARGLEAWLGVAGVLAFGVLFVSTDGDEFYFADVAFASVFVGTPWAVGLALRLRKERESVLTEENRRLQDENARAVAAERTRIARELHDVVSHAIAVTVLQARGGRRMLGVDDHEVRRALDAIEQTNTQALSDMRRLLSLLRDSEDDGRADPQPSLDKLDALLDQFRASGLSVRVQVHGQEPDAAPVPPGVDLSAYRIIQEALTNVLRHAGEEATAIVDLVYGAHDLTVTVSDDGRARTQPNHHGHGLLGIRERVAVVGGQVEAGPGADGGFAVRARLPYALETTG